MHKLARAIRFSLNPFLPADPAGVERAAGAGGGNSYASRPAGAGVAIFFVLWVELEGEIDPDTGFVVNVVEIDRVVRESVVPIFDRRLRDKYRAGEHVGLRQMCDILSEAWRQLEGSFGDRRLRRVCVELNPFRTLAIESEDCSVVYFSEKFEFAATHTLWNDKFSDDKNLAVFGKCAHRGGHGHNYVIEVTVKGPLGQQELGIEAFEQAVKSELLDLVDHKNLNADVAKFAETNPTVENIAAFAWERLTGKFAAVELTSVTVWENDRTYCTFCG